MAFPNILRPKVCQFLTLVNSPSSFHRICLPVNYAVIKCQVGQLNVPVQCRGYKKKLDVSHLKPLNFDYSEDLVKQEPLDPSELRFMFRDIPEVQDLPDHIKRSFTVEYASSQEKQEHRNAILLEKVTDLIGPGPCLEKEICYLTVKIRNLIPYIVSDRRNKRHKSYLIERIAKRKNLLKQLRQLDYDRFLWLLKELKVTWSPEDPYRYHKLSKKAVIKREVREEMLKEKKMKSEKLQADLDEEKEKFYQMKKKVLKEIDKDIKQYGLDKEKLVNTFKERKIEEYKKKVESMQKLNKLERTIKEMKVQKIIDRKVF